MIMDLTWKVCLGLMALIAVAWALGVLPGAVKLSQALSKANIDQTSMLSNNLKDWPALRVETWPPPAGRHYLG